MTAIKIATFICLILLGASVLDSIAPDTGVFIIILTSLYGGSIGLGYIGGYSIGAFETSQYLKEKYTLEEKAQS